jgi:hypothetical protein
MTVKNFSNSVAAGSVVGVVEAHRLSAPCEFTRFLSTYRKPICMCSLGYGVCKSNGKKVRLLFYSSSGFYRVTWVCDKLDGVHV